MSAIYTSDNCHQLMRRPSTEDGTPQWYPRQTVYGGPEAASMGLRPIEDYPDVLVDWDDAKEIIAFCHATEIFPMYHLDASGVMDAGWDQDGYGFCWAYGLSAAVMSCRAAEGKAPVRLAPFSLGWLVNWRNSGYYCDRAIAGARQAGIASAEYVPEHTLNSSRFKAGWQDDALQYVPTEWWDTRKPDDITMLRQLLSILRTGRAGYEAFIWWSHALACVGMDWDESQRNNVVTIHWNSHADGLIRMSGSRGVPDELYGVRATKHVDA